MVGVCVRVDEVINQVTMRWYENTNRIDENRVVKSAFKSEIIGVV